MRHRSGGITGIVVLVAMVGVLSAPAVVEAQAPDARWLPWIGCWEPAERLDPDAPITCFRPAGAGAVEMLTVTARGVVESRALVADGVERSTERSGCPTMERAEFSADGTRVYLSAERQCQGEVGRTSTGLMAMVERDRWLHARAMDVGGRSAGWSELYAPAPRSRMVEAGLEDILALTGTHRSDIETARIYASAPITIDEIIEAHARTDAEVVRAWLAEQQHRLELEAAELTRLAEAGVAEAVIDVAVAIAYPERFALARDPVDERRRAHATYPVYYDPFWSPYHGFGYRSGWGTGFYDPFWYGGRGWHRSTVIVVTPRDDTPRTRVVPGQGYTRGGANSGGGGDGRAARAPQRPTTASPPAATSRPATQRPAASSGERRPSSGGTPRTARPRGGGDE